MVYPPTGSRPVVVVQCIYEQYVFSHSVSTSSAECNRCSPASSLVCRQLLTICDIVWRLPQGQMSVAARPHFFQQDAQWPWLVGKRFRSAQWCLDRLNPDCWIAGSSTREELTTQGGDEHPIHTPRWACCTALYLVTFLQSDMQSN